MPALALLGVTPRPHPLGRVRVAEVERGGVALELRDPPRSGDVPLLVVEAAMPATASTCLRFEAPTTARYAAGAKPTLWM